MIYILSHSELNIVNALLPVGTKIACAGDSRITDDEMLMIISVDS